MLAIFEPITDISHRYAFVPILVSLRSFGKRLIVPSRSSSSGATFLNGASTSTLRSILISTSLLVSGFPLLRSIASPAAGNTWPSSGQFRRLGHFRANRYPLLQSQLITFTPTDPHRKR